MNLLMLIIIALALIAGGAILYVAWELSADTPRARSGVVSGEDEPGAGEESKPTPGSP